MLKNYLTTALRNLNRNRIHTFINLMGLALSLACCIVIYILVRYEYSFDHFVPDRENIYRIVTHTYNPDGIDYRGAVCFPMAEALRNEVAGVAYAAELYMDHNATIKVIDEEGQTKLFEERSMAYSENELLHIFDFPVLAGNPQKLLQQPDEAVLTRSLAEKMFGNISLSDIVGQTVSVNQANYQVSGILEDIPRNSSVYCTILLPFQVFQRAHPGWSSSWSNVPGQNNAFVKLDKGVSASRLEAQLISLPQKYLNEELAHRRSFHTQALADIHTDPTYGGTLYATPKALLITLVTMGGIILITACINFINMATAQAMKRAKEIGIRKTMGSSQWQITWQFVGETCIIVLLATLTGAGLAEYFLGNINKYLEAFSEFVVFNLSADYTLFFFLLGIIVVVTLGAGWYPAHIMAAYKPVVALKQSLTGQNAGFAGRFSLRKTLVIVQFAISQLLIIGTLVVTLQLQHFRQLDVGFAKEQVLNIEMNMAMPADALQDTEAFRHKLMAQASVAHVAFYSNPPTSVGNNFVTFYKKSASNAEKYTIMEKSVDEHYLDLFEIRLLAGRKLHLSDHHSDNTHQYNILMNETALRMLGYERPEEALGEVVVLNDDDATIVGVIGDFANTSLQHATKPCYLHYGDKIYYAGVKLTGQNTSESLSMIRNIWQTIYPDHLYRAKFIDEYIAILYVLEDAMYQLVRLASVLAIAIGCMGLYGLVSYLSLHRRKEIGIRKTPGASAQQIIYLFSKEFTWLVVAGFLVSAPLGYFTMQKWLTSFAYRIDMHWWYFALALLVTICIAWITVGYKSVSAALANPADSLKDE